MRFDTISVMALIKNIPFVQFSEYTMELIPIDQRNDMFLGVIQYHLSKNYEIENILYIEI